MSNPANDNVDVSSNTFVNDDQIIKDLIIELLLKKRNLFFKSQQMGEPELSLEEKKLILNEMLDVDKSRFLQRYGQYLEEEHLHYFTTKNDVDVEILVKDLQSKLKLKKKMIRNRRYRAMQDLLHKGVYFSQSEMQTRNPFLFEQMVGQHLSGKEKKDLQNEHYRNNYDQPGFSSFLMEQIRTIHLKCDYFVQEKEHMKPARHDEEEELNDSDDDKNEQISQGSLTVDTKEKETLQQEFKELMMQHFLNGLDTEYFDYDQVDNDDSYDLCEEYHRDCQDEYFDAD